MKRFYFILYFLLMSPCIYAQYSNEYANACDSTSKYLVVPIMPEFEGGTARLIEILNANLNIDKKVKATIHLRFLVNCKGEASGFSVYDGINEAIDHQLIRILEEQQSWRPGIHQGKQVDCLYALTLYIKKGVIK